MSSRSLAQIALRQWRNGGQFADVILSGLLSSSELAGPDRAFATDLFYGVLRNLTLLDFWIASLRSRHLDRDARDLLRLGLYQLLLLETPEHAAVYETVELAAERSRPLINGVLRSAARKKSNLLRQANEQDIRVRKSHPSFLIDRWTKSFGAENTERLCGWNNLPAPIYARMNRIKISEDAFLSQHPAGQRLSTWENFIGLTKIPSDALVAGHCYIQDPSTAAACRLLDPQPGESVLDACAAPGGKTGYLAELMKNEGFILACDRDENRVDTLRHNLERLGVRIVRCLRHDWATRESPFDRTGFDRILIDAPCSNTGVMRRRVDLRWRLTSEDFLHMPAAQARIVRASVPLLRPRGTLVYSTCSIEPEENEEVVRVILQEFPFLKLIEQISLLPFRDGFDGAYAAKLTRE